MDDLKQDVKEIKSHVIELVKQSAIHNQILSEHEKRSTSLETRLKPIEDTYVFIAKLAGTMMVMIPVAAAVFEIIEYLKK